MQPRKFHWKNFFSAAGPQKAKGNYQCHIARAGSSLFSLLFSLTYGIIGVVASHSLSLSLWSEEKNISFPLHFWNLLACIRNGELSVEITLRKRRRRKGPGNWTCTINAIASLSAAPFATQKIVRPSFLSCTFGVGFNAHAHKKMCNKPLIFFPAMKQFLSTRAK